MKNFPYLILLSSLVFNLYALTLDEAVQTALDNSTDVKSLELSTKSAQSDIKDKKSANYGRVDFVASYNHYNLPRTLTPLTPASLAGGAAGVPTTQDLINAGVSYNVDLFTGMKDTRSIEISTLAHEISKTQASLTKEQIVYNVKTLYMNILAQEATLRAQKEYVEALKKLHSNIQLKEHLGQLSHLDALKSQADFSHASSQLAGIVSGLEILKESLATIMMVESVENLEDVAIDVKALEEGNDVNLLENTRKIKLAKLDIEKSIKQEELSSSAYYPQLGFNAYYGQSGGVNDETNAHSGEWDNAEVWQAGVDLKWNIFDFGKTSAQNQKSKIATMKSRLSAAKTSRELQASFKEALSKIKLAVANYKSAQNELLLMDETQKIEQIRYDNGATDINDLLYAKSRYVLAKSSVIASEYEYQNALSYLDYILEKGVKND